MVQTYLVFPVVAALPTKAGGKAAQPTAAWPITRRVAGLRVSCRDFLAPSSVEQGSR